MYSFNFFEPERKFKFNVRGRICVMSKFDVVVEAVILTPETESLMPSHPCIFPFFEPFKLTSGLYKKLHLHLFKFPHPENKLPGNYFIPECFSYLRNPKWYLHPPSLLNIKKINKDPLCSFGTKINFICTLRG